jgi:hypothetical protein
LSASDIVSTLDGYLNYKRFGEVNVDAEIVQVIDTFVEVIKSNGGRI